MIAVFATALTTWIALAVMNVIDLGGFLLEGTVAVLVGAGAGFIIPFLRARQRRQERRS